MILRNILAIGMYQNGLIYIINAIKIKQINHNSEYI